jgi:hypothetical protein
VAWTCALFAVRNSHKGATMTFIETVSEQQAKGATSELYATDRKAFGDLPNFTQAFSLRPEVYAAREGADRRSADRE